MPYAWLNKYIIRLFVKKKKEYIRRSRYIITWLHMSMNLWEERIETLSFIHLCFGLLHYNLIMSQKGPEIPKKNKNPVQNYETYTTQLNWKCCISLAAKRGSGCVYNGDGGQVGLAVLKRDIIYMKRQLINIKNINGVCSLAWLNSGAIFLIYD